MGKYNACIVAAGKSTGVLMALATARDYGAREQMYTFNNNVEFVGAILDHARQSGHSILINIILALDGLRAQGKKRFQLHRIPAHKEVKRNAKLDDATKLATGWQENRY